MVDVDPDPDPGSALEKMDPDQFQDNWTFNIIFKFFCLNYLFDRFLSIAALHCLSEWSESETTPLVSGVHGGVKAEHSFASGSAFAVGEDFFLRRDMITGETLFSVWLIESFLFRQEEGSTWEEKKLIKIKCQ